MKVRLIPDVGVVTRCRCLGQVFPALVVLKREYIYPSPADLVPITGVDFSSIGCLPLLASLTQWQATVGLETPRWDAASELSGPHSSLLSF